MRKILKKFIYKILRFRKFNSYMANHYANLIVHDICDSENSFLDKIWTYRRGFLSSRIKNYNLTKENYKDFLSDYDYYKMFPVNGQEMVWINDKLTTKYIYAPFDEFFPEYYFMINNGNVTALHNIPRCREYSISDVVEKLKERKVLAFKMEASAAGVGFYRVEYIDDNFIVNGKILSEKEFVKFLSELKEYLVMEYITAHHEIKKYYDRSTGVLRVMVINEGNHPIIANAHIKVGSHLTGVLDANDGCITSVVDLDSGEFGKEVFIQNGFDFIRIEEHPDSKIPFCGIIPRWEYIKKKVIEMAEYTPQLSYLGFDVCVTEDSFKIYEINSHQGISLYQLSYPLLRDNPATEFFKKQIRRCKGK